MSLEEENRILLVRMQMEASRNAMLDVDIRIKQKLL